jgi:PAS domain S-box-containing protein
VSDETNKVTQHKAGPEDLQASEIRYRRLFEAARDGILILDAASRKITDVNPFMVELLGYSRDEFLGTELWEIGLFQDKNESQTAFRELQATGYIRYEDMPLRTKAGKQWNVEFISNVYQENAHHVIQCNIRDITARKRAEETLAQANKRVVDILESISEAFFAVDHEWRFTYLNRQAEPLLQRTRDQILGKSIWEEFPEVVDSVFAVGSVFYEQYRKAAAEQVKVNFEEFFPPLDTWFEVRIYPGPDGLSVYFHDIGVRKHAERELKVSEVRYRRLFEAAHDGILILNAETGRIGDVNPFLCELLDYPKAEFLGKELWEIGLFKDKEESRAAFRELQATGHIRYEDIPLETKGGVRREVEFISNVYQENGHNVIQCNIRDITERKHAENERNELLARTLRAQGVAEGANRLKDEFLATLSHELRTPLTAIVGWADMLVEPRLDPIQAVHGIEVIRRNAQAQVKMIDDLLDVSRIITGKLRLTVQPVDLGTIIMAAVDSERLAAEAKEIRLQLQLDSPSGQVSGDPDRLQQVIWNLVSNAIKFTPKGGRVLVRLERVNSHVEITVADTGKGIALEFLPRVFDRFRQEDATTTRTFGGLGLGLAIVRQLAELHGGTVQVDSAGEGQGSTFTVSLPLLAVRGSASDAEHLHSPIALTEFDWTPQLEGVRVLVVDDEVDTRELLQVILEGRKAQVRTASSAAAALEALAEETFDVLISDIGMPEEDGYALIAKVRALDKERGGRIPAAALTAYAGEEDRIRTLRSGFQIHVPKPISPNELLAVVANLADRTGQD